MKYKLICSDFDDTLIGKGGKYSPTLKDDIQEYVNRGGKFCIVTGRMTIGIVPTAKALGLHGEVISYQGAVVSDIDTDEIYFSDSIPCEECVKIGEYLESKGYYYQAYSMDKILTENPNEFTRIYSQISNAEYSKTDVKLSEYLKMRNMSSPKLLVMDVVERIPMIKEELNALFGKDYLINTSKPFIIEIIPKGISKGKAVLELAKKYGIKKEEIIGIGDSENDLTMLDSCGLSFCVANGSEIAKQHADMIAPSADENGVGYVIRNYGLK